MEYQNNRLSNVSHIREPSSDPFSSEEFDVGQYLDNYFPKEPTIETASILSQNLKQKIDDVETEISALLIDKNDSNQKALKDLEITKYNIKLLYDRISSIKSKSAEAEEAVREITKDIKSLDHAKKNLTMTITFFRRLQMLSRGIKQIQILLPEKRFQECAGLFQASIELMNNFNDYLRIKNISILNNDLQKLIADGKCAAMAELEKGINVHGVVVANSSQLAEICLFGDALMIKDEILGYYIKSQLKGYKDIFQLNDDEHEKIFPKSWRADFHLSHEFCKLTREMIYEQLKNTENIDIDIMVSALTSTVAFEIQLDKKYNADSDEATEFNSNNDKQDIFSNLFEKSISGVFGPHMFQYITHQDTVYSDLIKSYRSIDADVLFIDEKNAIALSSSTDLLYLYREDLRKCAQFSTNTLLYDLFKVFDDKLQLYADFVLNYNITRYLTSSSPGLEKIKIITLLTNTTNYVIASVAQLESKMIEKIDTEFKEKISFEKSHLTLLDTANNSIGALVKASIELCDSGFSDLLKTKWVNRQGVVDQSEYIYLISSGLEESVIQIRSYIKNTSYIRLFCDRLSIDFLDKYLNSIFLLKEIDEIGAEQLLLDFQTIKATVYKLPIMSKVIADSETKEVYSANALKMYKENVNNKTRVIESTLKTLLAPTDLPEKFVLQFISLFKEPSIALLEKILELKGIKSSDKKRKFISLYCDSVDATKDPSFKEEYGQMIRLLSFSPNTQNHTSNFSNISDKVNLANKDASATSVSQRESKAQPGLGLSLQENEIGTADSLRKNGSVFGLRISKDPSQNNSPSEIQTKYNYSSQNSPQVNKIRNEESFESSRNSVGDRISSFFSKGKDKSFGNTFLSSSGKDGLLDARFSNKVEMSPNETFNIGSVSSIDDTYKFPSHSPKMLSETLSVRSQPSPDSPIQRSQPGFNFNIKRLVDNIKPKKK
ncbi:hypothetical protein BB560_001338 [Smittium megazygosporum]|uniref:Uncharacterized protein n=1 Tax=Smittium megazygosporum TaxID=133381 RepID=A0A2T9ZHX0_9FUNG|nr:hypothetical protein BB560_001338 [Smittium megazygosporum]